MFTKTLRSVLALLFIAGCVTPAFADEDPAPAASSRPAAVEPATPDAVTHHTLSLDGKTLAYTARAGTITLRTQDDQPQLRMFYTAYTLDGSALEHRPVTFIYNGGPGSSTMWLRMGSVGPVRVQTADGGLNGPAPYHLADNQYSLLDKSDLVFIDMPTSGFGRLIGSGKPKDFYGLDKDAQAFAQFITRYLTQYDRWNSPKFLMGESYGTTRSAALVNILQNDGVSMNGVVLISSILNFGIDYGDVSGGGDWAYVLYLPTEAATAWYHHALSNAPADVHQLLPEVEHFAMNQYLDALAKGAQISRTQFDDTVRMLHRYTGLSEQYIRNSNLRIPYWRFENELLRSQGKIVGRLDGRYETQAVDRPAENPPWDPTDAAIDSPFTSMSNLYLREDLKYNTNLTYRANVYGLIAQNGDWDMKHAGNATPNVAPDLAQAMTYNPNLKVFSANGYYDFATPYFATVYTLNHLNIAPQIQKNITFGFYESGHMVYLRSAVSAQFKADLDRWYDEVLSGR